MKTTIAAKFPDFSKLYSQISKNEYNAFYRFKGKTLKVFIHLDSVTHQNQAKIYTLVNDEWKFFAELFKLQTPSNLMYKDRKLTEDDFALDIDELFTIAQAVL